MSGRAYGSHYAVPEPEREPSAQPCPRETSQLAESLSRLFVSKSQPKVASKVIFGAVRKLMLNVQDISCLRLHLFVYKHNHLSTICCAC